MSKTSKDLPVDLFASVTTDKSLLLRIDAVVGARIKGGCLYVELELRGPEPPKRWLSSLTCRFVDQMTGKTISARIACITHRDGDTILVRTQPLQPTRDDGDLPQGTAILIRSDRGVEYKKILHSNDDDSGS